MNSAPVDTRTVNVLYTLWDEIKHQRSLFAITLTNTDRFLPHLKSVAALLWEIWMISSTTLRDSHSIQKRCKIIYLHYIYRDVILIMCLCHLIYITARVKISAISTHACFELHTPLVNEWVGSHFSAENLQYRGKIGVTGIDPWPTDPSDMWPMTHEIWPTTHHI